MSGGDSIYETVEKILKMKPRQVATHIGKFSHPDAQTNILLLDAVKSNDGLLKSGSVDDTEFDSPGDAATSAIAKFMFEKLSDGQTVYQHLQQNTQEARDHLSIYGSNYDNTRESLLKLLVVPVATKEASSSELKQIYFPVNNDYHLLTVLLPIGLVSQLHEKLKKIRFSEETKSSKDARKKGEYSADGYDDIWNLTTISYGGANPQNFSYLATRLKGCCLLSCLPPKINKRSKLPKRNFFTDVLWTKDYEDIFQSFHKLQVADWNNEKIRKGRDAWVTYCVDKLIIEVWRIRGEDAGWSDFENYKNLPPHQKIWLDNKYRDERDLPEFEVFAKQIAEDIARWFMHGYDKTLGGRKVLLGDDFLRYVKDLINTESLR